MAGATANPTILGCRLRVARLDASGATPAGATNLYVSDQMVELSAADEVEGGTEISQRTACGDYAWDPYVGPDFTKWKNLELTLARPDDELIEMLTGAALITSGGNTIGHADPALGVKPPGFGVSLEIWAMRLQDGVQAATNGWVWSVLPRTYNWKQGPRRWFNGAHVPTFTGRGGENSGWGNGPANNWPGPSDRALATIITGIDPPAPAVGYQATIAQV